MKKQPKRSLQLQVEKLGTELKKRSQAWATLKRDLEIEKSLERVRTVAIAMRDPEDLLQVCTLLFSQLKKLGFRELRNAMINIHDDQAGSLLNYDCSGPTVQTITQVAYKSHPATENLVKQVRKNKDAFAQFAIKGDKLNEWRQYRKRLGETDDPRLDKTTTLSYYFYSIGIGAIGISTYRPIDQEKVSLLKRFRNVFELAYRRYMDVTQAEVQAREARIELALERVRARTMAMQKSEELQQTAYVLFQQFKELGEDPLQITIGIIDEHARTIDFHVTDWSGSGSEVNRSFKASIDEPHLLKKVFNAWKEQRKSLVVDLAGQPLQEWIKYRDQLSGIQDRKFQSDGRRVVTAAFFSKGEVSISTPEPRPAETIELLERFAKVFDLTYTRFLDLKNAEAQVREANIEAALERVRSKAMAMQKSEDLADAVAIVFEQMDKLDLGMLRCGIGILDKVKRTADVWTTTKSDNNTVVQVSGDESMDLHPLLQGAFESWLDHKEDYYYELQGEDLRNYYVAISGTNFHLPKSQSFISPAKGMLQYYYLATFSAGALFAFRETPFPEEAKKVIKRFADVFHLTYTRFSDLKHAEAQARESKIETALERVRSRTLAMQKSTELAETAAVLFKQLILLGIAPNRLYIGIIKDQGGHIEFWVTDEDGSKVSTQFIGDASRNESMKKMYNAWNEQKQSIVIDMQGRELADYFHYLSDELGVPFKQGLSQKRRMQSIAFFGKGFIGIASPEDQSEETIELLKRFASVFNLTYARFNDLQMAEHHAEQSELDLIRLKEEKKRTEDALTELQATQKQLIQAEKMASLGQLTAGIAHEIQNPLNFVNNFSELSAELVEEMNDQLASGAVDDVKAIAINLKLNLEKIHHHGQRAGDIVKGMLQHSRSSTGLKEPTDINKLVDEYLRLAYHGLRAKDKSFNATLNADYDQSIGNIQVIPQDIGRVILNLITNAFYAVDEKKIGLGQSPLGLASASESGVPYAPTVSVTTRKLGDKIEIRVKDNGDGIAEEVMDRIFQPFFTTKPAGQGTGLGLSLSYDIIKAHGGEILAISEQGEGAEFAILLPCEQS